MAAEVVFASAAIQILRGVFRCVFFACIGRRDKRPSNFTTDCRILRHRARALRPVDLPFLRVAGPIQQSQSSARLSMTAPVSVNFIFISRVVVYQSNTYKFSAFEFDRGLVYYSLLPPDGQDPRNCRTARLRDGALGEASE